ncbi:MAG: cation transporter [Bacteroidetes bacterium]|nr:MAG: cation transporter [Bacteroidota bacterium]
MSKKKEQKAGIKQRTAALSIMSNVALIIMKAIAGFFSGSVSIISEAIHSTLDLLAAVIAFFAVRVSDKPADKEHPFGHGKYENISGVVEALLIFAAAIWIIYEAVVKLVSSETILEHEKLDIGIVVMLVSGLVNFFVSRRLYKVARQTGSVALEADALHLKTDIYTSVGVGLGLLAIKLTGFYFLDPAIALLVAGFITIEAFGLLKKAFNPLLDSSISDDELAELVAFIENNIDYPYSYSDLRTRKSGATNIIQFKIIAEHQTMLIDAVIERKILNDRIIKQFPNSELIIILDVIDE